MYSLRSPLNGSVATKRRRFGADLNNRRTKAFRLHAEEVQNSLKEWERDLNAINTDPAPIFVENKVARGTTAGALFDLRGPRSFHYRSKVINF